MTSPNPSVLNVAASDETTIAFLRWNTTVSGRDSMPLACPQCAGPHLHLDTIHVAAPTTGQYEPGAGIAINPDIATAIHDDESRRLHAGKNRGPMLSVGYWCEDQCRGRIELRSRKGYRYASLHNESLDDCEIPPIDTALHPGGRL